MTHTWGSGLLFYCHTWNRQDYLHWDLNKEQIATIAFSIYSWEQPRANKQDMPPNKIPSVSCDQWVYWSTPAFDYLCMSAAISCCRVYTGCSFHRVTLRAVSPVKWWATTWARTEWRRHICILTGGWKAHWMIDYKWLRHRDGNKRKIQQLINAELIISWITR